jgi:hypothetical protein
MAMIEAATQAFRPRPNAPGANPDAGPDKDAEIAALRAELDALKAGKS